MTAIVSVQNRYNVVRPMLGLCDLEMVVFIPWAPIEETGTIPALMPAARRRGDRQLGRGPGPAASSCPGNSVTRQDNRARTWRVRTRAAPARSAMHVSRPEG